MPSVICIGSLHWREEAVWGADHLDKSVGLNVNLVTRRVDLRCHKVTLHIGSNPVVDAAFQEVENVEILIAVGGDVGRYSGIFIRYRCTLGVISRGQPSPLWLSTVRPILRHP